MTQADRVHSTPPLNTPSIIPRRNVLAALALLPAAGLPALAEQSADPTFAVIDQCREAQRFADVMVQCRQRRGETTVRRAP
jgi:hypothetical protein